MLNVVAIFTPMEKQSRIVKFSICIRKETQALLDKLANQENRSRSSMIDVLCFDNGKKLLKEEKK